MATHSSILAWRIPWTVKPGRLGSAMGSVHGVAELGMTERFSFPYSLSLFTVLSFILCLFCLSSSVL